MILEIIIPVAVVAAMLYVADKADKADKRQDREIKSSTKVKGGKRENE